MAVATIVLGGLILAIAAPAHGDGSSYFAAFVLLCAAVLVVYWIKAIVKVALMLTLAAGVVYVGYLVLSHR